MQIKVFTIPLFDNTAITEEMNSFLRCHKVLTVDRQQVTLGEQAFWTFCVTYLPQTTYENGNKTDKVDFKEILDTPTFEVFSKLRTIRKKLADQDAVPAFAVFTDAELAEIAKLETIDAKNMLTIKGIGQKKVEKYGTQMSEQYLQITNQKTE